MSEHVQQHPNGIELRVQDLETAMWGDRTNPEKRPGLLRENERRDFEQKRTNEILTEFRADFKKLAILVAGGILTGLVELVLKK